MNLEKELLERIVASVLEDSAFVFAMPMDEAPPELASWNAVGVRLKFQGHFSGYCELWAPFEVAKILSSNMLGMDDDCPDAQEMCFDALKESLNIICGNMLTEVAGEEPVFNLGTPTTLSRPEPLTEEGTSAETWFDADEHPILFRVHVDLSADAAA